MIKVENARSRGTVLWNIGWERLKVVPRVDQILFAGQYHSMEMSDRCLLNCCCGALRESATANNVDAAVEEDWTKPMGEMLISVCT